MVQGITGRIFVLFVSVVFLISTSCTSYHLINQESESVMKNIKAGDKVRITTKGNRVLKLKINEIGEESLVGDNLETPSADIQTVQFSEIVKLEKRELSTGRTVGLSLGILLGIPALVALLWYGFAPCFTCD